MVENVLWIEEAPWISGGEVESMGSKLAVVDRTVKCVCVCVSMCVCVCIYLYVHPY